jgi:hypothetical protein
MRRENVRDASESHGGNGGAGEHSAALESVARALQGIDYGSVLIRVHQGEVVSIETSVKHRLAPGN